jgi:hypothetical protein
MKCSDARFAIGADPAGVGPALAEHLQACAPCAGYLRDMRALDEQLRAAMTIPVPEIASASAPCPSSSRRLWLRFMTPLALAASVAVTSLVAGLLWIGVPRPSLASAVVAHMAEEQGTWSTTGTVPLTGLAPVLSRAGVRLDTDLADVTYARSCWFQGHYVPHLVVRTADGPVTILVLPHENIRERIVFSEGGYRGVLVPTARGSLAVLARDGRDVDAVVAQATAAVGYVN